MARRKKPCEWCEDDKHVVVSETRLYRIWTGMKDRCYREKHPKYKNYGGRGIKVCNEWLGHGGFARFAEWAAENGYRNDKSRWECSIDRIDPDGDYSPANCRWATITEQNNNKRTNRFVDYNGERLTLSMIAEKYGIKKTTLRERLHSGWSAEKAIETPIRLRTKGYRPSTQANDENGELIEDSVQIPMNFCPNCGRDLRGSVGE